VEDPRFKEPPLKISGDADCHDHRIGIPVVISATALHPPLRDEHSGGLWRYLTLVV
jgi:hypothetical protein